LQLAVMCSRLVNGGKAVKPKIFLEKDAVINTPEDIGILPENLRIVLQGMDDVYNNPRGTAFPFRSRSKDYKIGGKTGTTQVTGISIAERKAGVIKNDKKEWIERDHAIFVGFGPLVAPKYAISVLVEHGGGGSTTASPIARDILEYILDQKSNDKIKVDQEYLV